MLKKSIFCQKGSIGIAIVVAILGFLSGITLVSISIVDTRGARLHFDQVQQNHFIRSEIGRSRILLSHFHTDPAGAPVPNHMTLPVREVQVQHDRSSTTYRLRTKIEKLIGTAHDGEYKVKTLTEAFRGRGMHGGIDEQSIVKKYSEVTLGDHESLATLQYFSDNENPYYGDYEGEIRFFGGDTFYGPVHVNSKMYIRNAGGGWPTFYGPVTVMEEVYVYPGHHQNYPADQIFLGGLTENYYELVFDPSADDIHAHGLTLGTHSDTNIMWVTVNGTSYTAWLGTVNETNIIDEYIIYDMYPPYGPIGNPIGVNQITRIDTTWTPAASGTLSEQSMMVPMELWISGDFSTRQTWGSTHDIYLKGDITLSGTSPGHPPDGIDPTADDFDPENPQLGSHGPWNRNDIVGLVSEESIYIQYGHRDPISGERMKPNTSSIWIYAAMAACGEGSGDEPWYGDGIFSFQYQFPKGATPDQYYQNELLTRIDLHLFQIPTTPFHEDWPPGIDYPWYNPLWPESGPTYFVSGYPWWPHGPGSPFTPPPGTPQVNKLRGVINMYGSVAQRRRGFVRRSGNADHDTGYWDIPNYIFGSPNPPIGPVGYDKEYYFDYRYLLHPRRDFRGPIHFPKKVWRRDEAVDEIHGLAFSTDSWQFLTPPRNF